MIGSTLSKGLRSSRNARGGRRRRVLSQRRPALALERLEPRQLLAGTILYRVNAGGPTVSGSPAWQADTVASPAPFESPQAASSASYVTTHAINTTDASLPPGTPASIFQSERWDDRSGAEMQWTFPVSPGNFEVRLYFAEIYADAQAPGRRVFDVQIEGQTVLQRYDVFAAAGGGYRGVMQSFTVASDDKLNVTFLHRTENPAIKAIEIISLADAPSGDPPPPDPDPAPPPTTGTTYRVNAGGPAIGGSLAWQSNGSSSTAWQNSSTSGSQVYSTTHALDRTHASVPAGTPPELFQTERWDPPTAAEMQWDFPVTPGDYQVRLYFAEIYSGAMAPGERRFDVVLEGQVVLANYDVFADVGGYRGVVKTFTVHADSNLDIDFVHRAGNPAIKAIEILPLDASPTPPPVDPPPPPPPPASSGTVVWRINAGGLSLAADPVWSRDTESSPSLATNASAAASHTYSVTSAIRVDHPSLPAGTPVDLLRSSRWDDRAGQEMEWSLPVDPGLYEVRFYFAETYSGVQGIGKRVFDVLVNDDVALSHYDIFADAGGGNRGVMRSVEVESDGQIDILFRHVVENPTVSGIEIVLLQPANRPPVVTAPAQNVVTAPGSSLIPVTASDPEGGAVTLATGALPSFVTFQDQGAGRGSFAVNPSFDDWGNYSLSVVATDAGSPPKSTEYVVALTVQPDPQYATTEYQINAGGPDLAGSPGWQADLPGTQSTAATTPVIDISSQLELFVDRYLIESLVGARLELHTPVAEAATADQHAAGQYPTIIFDGTQYQHYYRGYVNPTPASPDGTNAEVTRYDVSTDGIHWTQPDLGLFSVNVTGPNNVVLAGAAPSMHNFMPFLDTRPGVDPQYRYKALAGLSHVGDKIASPSGLRAYASPDGVHWSLYAPQPVITVADLPDAFDSYAFDSANVAFWSEMEQKYVVYYRTWTQGAPGGSSLRTFTRAESDDFIHWTNHRDITVNYADEHLYTSAVQPYFRAPQIYTAMPTQFLPSQPNDNTRVLFMTSRDGITFDRTFGQQTFIQGLPGNRQNYVAPLVVQTGPDELSIYGQSGTRYTLRLDGFSSVDTTGTSGEMLTKPLLFQGRELALNFTTGAAGSVRVEIQNASGQVIPGYSLAESNSLSGDSIAGVVTWNGNADLSSLAGRAVRLRVVMQDADVYALQFQGQADGVLFDAAAQSRTLATNLAIALSSSGLLDDVPTALFQSARIDRPFGTPLSWSVPVTPGLHEVRLYFAEIDPLAQHAGARVFDVDVEGQTRLNNYDIFADVGGYHGTVRSIFVQTDDQLDITLRSVAGQPLLNGLEVLSYTAPGGGEGEAVRAEVFANLDAGFVLESRWS